MQSQKFIFFALFFALSKYTFCQVFGRYVKRSIHTYTLLQAKRRRQTNYIAGAAFLPSAHYTLTGFIPIKTYVKGGTC